MNKLKECKPGENFSIKYLDGTEEQKRHLQNLGFVPTTIVGVISVINENMIVQVFDSRIAINDEISDHVYGTILKKDIAKPKRLSLFKKR
jgi:ferrous iron transport protein A